MTEPTPSTIKNRVVAMCATLGGVNTSADKFKANESAFTDAELPAAVTEMIYRPATFTRVDRATFEMLTPLTIKFMVRRYAIDYKLTDQVAWEAVEPYRLLVPALFFRYPQLQLNDNGLAIGSNLDELFVGPIADSKALYASVIYELTVRTLHSV